MAESNRKWLWLGASLATAVGATFAFFFRKRAQMPAVRSSFVSQRLREYVDEHSVQGREPPILQRLRKATKEATWVPFMQVSADEAQLLHILLKTMQAKRVIEIGVFTGYSALATALALPADGKIIACDVSEKWTSIGRRFWQEAGVEDKIDLRLAPAVETLDALLEEGQENSFDFAFIDADKENYLNYYERCLRLLRPGGVVAVDNVLWHGRVTHAVDQTAGTRAIRALNERISKDARVDVVMLTVGDGLTLCRKREL